MAFDKDDIRIAKLFIGKKARMENFDVFYRGAVDVKVLSVDDKGIMTCKLKSTCCD